MTDDELNIAIEEKVFGKQVRFEKHDLIRDVQYPHLNRCMNCDMMFLRDEMAVEPCQIYYGDYATSPSDDYLVLKHVREWWVDRNSCNYAFYLSFSEILDWIWDMRLRNSSLPWVPTSLLYEPGDYSRAALKALGVNIEQEVKA